MSISTNALAVRDGHANSHAKKGWELFTDAAIRALAQQRSGLIFLLWGNSAQEKIKQVATTLHVNIFFYWCVSLPFSIFLTTLFSFMDPVIHRQSINVLQEVSYVVKLIVYDWIRKHTHTFYILARECVSQMFATLSGWRENSFMKITQVLANISRRLLHSFKDRKTNSSHMIFSVFVKNRLLPSVFKMQKKEVEW